MEALSNATEGHTKRPLFLAAEKGHAAVVRRLLATGADANAVATVAGSGAVSRLSPLWAARRGGHAEAEAALVAAGAVEVAEMQPLPPSLDDSGSGRIFFSITRLRNANFPLRSCPRAECWIEIMAFSVLLGPAATAFSVQFDRSPTVGEMCSVLVDFADEGCHVAFRQKDADSCAVELTPYDSGGDEAEAALDSIPAKLAEALKAVNVESKCVRDQVRGIIEAAAWGK
ncbi:hypothetical protein EMIHUDRAFT_465843 [Emiliania huxleyi CCMP1516]|uniref:Uncharacterized protein n=2 Tax=Emiliania huxleyi TaxID=2903 RepID=A0A0D3I5I8_EMIH1|nr:hypothetical protein EMIHUDRAFT_465843 [Emiliania huxleyi CCMP1516]EOD06523.1 hypothetical protein EMIHUDRAFT_465843 [Emiliania huxleyi CCMP1516]|eukprot:XP_005758952.1 hypothetical protein EMIHUDRAFT_465843 [Emiliania huxleyi CCMP1516]